MLVEDSDINVFVVIYYLIWCGVCVICVVNGCEVFVVLDKYCFDVVLMDVFMLEMDGLEVIMCLCEWEELVVLFVIVLIVYVVEVDICVCEDVGMNSFLFKLID